jgi:hypothetical protein
MYISHTERHQRHYHVDIIHVLGELFGYQSLEEGGKSGKGGENGQSHTEEV